MAFRTVGLLAALLFLGAMYLLGRELGGPPLGAWALFFAAVNGLQFFYGAFPGMFQFSNLFAAAAYAGYLFWRRTGRGWGLLAAALGFFGLFHSAWWYYPAVLPVAADLFFFRPRGLRRARTVGVLVFLLPAAVFAAYQAYFVYGIPWITGVETFPSLVTQNLVYRTRFGLYLLPDFYRAVWREGSPGFRPSSSSRRRASSPLPSAAFSRPPAAGRRGTPQAFSSSSPCPSS